MDKIKLFLSKFWADNGIKITEAVKAALRYLGFLLVSSLVEQLLKEPHLTPMVFAVLTAADAWIHQNWKENGKSGLRGISPV